MFVNVLERPAVTGAVGLRMQVLNQPPKLHTWPGTSIPLSIHATAHCPHRHSSFGNLSLPCVPSGRVYVAPPVGPGGNDDEGNDDGLSVEAIVGIVTAVLVFFGGGAAAYHFKCVDIHVCNRITHHNPPAGTS